MMDQARGVDNRPMHVEGIKSLLAELDSTLLLVALVHLTNDFSLLRKYRDRFVPTEAPEAWLPKWATPIYSVDDASAAEIHDLLARELMRSREPLLHAPLDVQLCEMLSFVVGEHISLEDAPFYLEQMGFITDARTITPTQIPPDDFTVLVMGAGMVGINLGVKLGRAGIKYTILEARSEVGGTWSVHNYPGAAVDIPALLYSFSFEPSRSWSMHFPGRDEYLQYLQGVADKYRVTDHIEFDTKMTGCVWDEGRSKWVVSAVHNGAQKTYEANVVITAAGFQTKPSIPDIDGMAAFNGAVIHPTNWEPSVDLADKTVVLVGTGATACQVAASVADTVNNLTVVQRQATWMLPNKLIGVPLSDAEHWARTNLPYYLNWSRARTWFLAGFAVPNQIIRIDPEWQQAHGSVSEANEQVMNRNLAYLREKLRDRPDLLAKMTPNFPMYAKYPVGDCGYLDTLLKPHVALETGSVERFESDALILNNGQRIECDVAIFATGFEFEFLSSVDIVGRDGKKLADEWEHGQEPYSYLGMMVPGFPNFFATSGPNSLALAGGHSFMSEEETHFIVEYVQALLENGLASMEPLPDETALHNKLIDEYLAGTVLMHGGGAHGWFRTAKGRVRVMGRWSGIESWNALRAPDLTKFDVSPASNA